MGKGAPGGFVSRSTPSRIVSWQARRSRGKSARTKQKTGGLATAGWGEKESARGARTLHTEAGGLLIAVARVVLPRILRRADVCVEVVPPDVRERLLERGQIRSAYGRIPKAQ